MPKVFFIIVVVLVVFGAGWFSFSKFVRSEVPSGPVITDEVTVRLAWLAQAQFVGIFVAEDKGMYKSGGLKVNIKEYENGNDQIQELVDGKVDFSIMSAAEFVKGASKGEKIKAVAVIYQDSPYAFASLKSKNINAPVDFKGKILGNVGGNDQARYTYQALMRNYKVNPEDARISDVGFEDMFDFAKGTVDTVDIYRTDQAFKMRQAGLEINLLFPERFGFYQYGDVLVTTDKMISEKPEIVRRFVQATLNGWEEALFNKEQAVEILLKYDNEEYHEKEYEQFILEESAPLLKPSGGKKIGAMDFVNWKKTYDVLKESNIIDQEIDISKYYTSSFLN